ncbi:hypothetical protein D3273_19235 [Lichenibacterium minor]|uniref:Uncharacterized protein n=1 Tax=Lichenibacterium minor TaxID=2316528 RepID=A0A4V1RU88_9HYPH|nr:hypothetical protein [Lichenibacterium minor]RYC30304.1 hypothetical protein D3273_19235 [Lichenibacterium minor]
MSRHRFSTADVLAAFRTHGVEPTFTSYTDPSQRLSFLCACPERSPGETTFRAVHYQRIVPLCPKCKTEDRQDRMRANRRVLALSSTPKARSAVDRHAAVVERYRQLFAEHGVTPLADYLGRATPIPFVCRGSCNALRGSIMPAALRGGQVPRCRKCQDAIRLRGEDHPRWNDERTPKERAGDRTAHDKRWDKEVVRAHQGMCVITGDPGTAPHHIYAWISYPELRHLLQNGTCLTEKLHVEFTARFPDGRNTHADFVAFYEEKTGCPCPIPDPMLLPQSELIFVE